MRELRVLDLFCGAGGAARGYELAGATSIVGVDHEPQPSYPYTFVQADAIEYLRGVIARGEASSFDLIHASPPCQRYSVTRHIHGNAEAHPDLVDDVRALLRLAGRPYVIENVPGAPLRDPLELCGSMFGLPLIRHRLFETKPRITFAPAPHACKHLRTYAHRGQSSFENGSTAICVAGGRFKVDDGKVAMGIDWVRNRNELAQAVPPAYTEWIGGELWQ